MLVLLLPVRALTFLSTIHEASTSRAFHQFVGNLLLGLATIRTSLMLMLREKPTYERYSRWTPCHLCLGSFTKSIRIRLHFHQIFSVQIITVISGRMLRGILRFGKRIVLEEFLKRLFLHLSSLIRYSKPPRRHLETPLQLFSKNEVSGVKRSRARLWFRLRLDERIQITEIKNFLPWNLVSPELHKLQIVLPFYFLFL